MKKTSLEKLNDAFNEITEKVCKGPSTAFRLREPKGVIAEIECNFCMSTTEIVTIDYIIKKHLKIVQQTYVSKPISPEATISIWFVFRRKGYERK